ncbi:protein split ends isoform X3 [Danaus plexippus]|nr:protein split ends isoform X3 [Danaus plexippus]
MENASANTNAVANSGVCATVAFMDIKSASKAHNVEHVLDERTLTTEYYEPAAIPSSAGAPSAGSSPAGSGYSGSSSSVNSAPVPVTTSRYHLSGEESAGNACAMAASAAAPATWRGTNDSATEYCRRGNTPAAYGRYQRNNSTAPYATTPTHVERTTPHHRWCSSVGGGAAGGESTPSTPGGGTERRRRLSESGSSRSETSSPEPSDTSRASTPPADHHAAHHTPRRTPPTHTHQWPSTANGRPLAICVRNLPTRSTDSSLKDGLYHEYKKHGKVVWVKVVGQNADRYAVVRFKKPSDVEKALEVSQDKLFFGCKISVAPHQSCDDDAESAKPYETDIDEYHPKATRTLFIGNLEKDVTQQQLRDKFKHFGRIIEIDIKKGSGGGAGYAFCQYASISSVVEAIRAMDGEYVGNSRVKLGFGKPVATTCVWVDGLTEHTEKQVLGAVSRCGAATSVCVDRAAGAALVHFEQAAAAGGAVRELRRVAAQLSAAEPDHPRLCVDYASRECQEAFYEQLEKHGGSAALAGAERVAGELPGRYVAPRHETLRYEAAGTNRSRAPSFSRASSRTPRYNANDHYDPAEYAADRRYRVFDDLGSSPQTDDANYEERLQSVVVSPHRGHKHRRDSSPEGRKHSKERHRSAGGGSRRSRSGSRGHSSRRRHRRRRDGSESRGSRASRAGTPLRDELDAPPTEPRRPPRERPPLPMSLPLPKFAVQLLRAAPPQPRLLPPAPASPPRPPSASSSSGGSAPHSPSLEERIRSLDEKYERWTGSRAHIDAPDRSRLRHRLLELDINEVKPSDVVRSLLAKRSVFDEDSERLEGATRAPSPGGSPRSLPVSTSRVLRYPFPVHGMHTSAVNTPLTNPAGLTQPPEPEEYDRSRLLNMDKITKHVDIENGQEIRMRLRTPSIDRPMLENFEKKHSPTSEKSEIRSLPETETQENRRRNSFISNVDDSKTATITDKATLERISLEKSIEKSILEIQEKYNIRDNKIICEDKITTSAVTSIKKEEIIEEKVKASDFFNKFERKCFREDTKSRCLESKSELKQELSMDMNKSDKYMLTSDYSSKTEVMLMDMKQKLDHDKKSEFNCQPKQNERFKDKYHNATNKNATNFRVQSESHFHSLNSIDLPKNKTEPAEESSHIEKSNKEMLLKSITCAKDNILLKQIDETHHVKCDKSNNVNVSTTSVPPQEKAAGKLQEDCAKIEKDKLRHIRDKLDKEIERDKSKIKQTSSKFDKHDKERKVKDDSLSTKIHTDKSDRTRNEKEGDKTLDKDRDFERSKVIEDKTSRHDNHKRDKQERDRKKDIPDNESMAKASKKEEKHKNDRPKKDSDNKRDNKREGDSSKSRKSSRDESIRDICRKDSTDSTTSRASHDSSKSRESENIELKEDMKTRIKSLSDVVNKVDTTDKDPTIKHHDHLKLDGKTKIKSEIKDEKDPSEQHFRNKIESYVDNKKIKTENSEKSRHYSLDSPSVDIKRKERLNSCSSLPSNIGHKRRMSSQDSIDCLNEEIKKGKSERRESKDCKSVERHKTTKFSKGHFAKIIESKTKDDKKNQVKPPDTTFTNPKCLDTKEIGNDKLKTSRKSPIESIESKTISAPTNISSEPLHNNFDFLATLELRSSEEDEKQKALRKEMKEKKRIQQLQQIQELQMQQDALQQAEIGNKIKDDRRIKSDDKKKDISREKRMSTERKSKDEKTDNIKRRNRKQLHSTDTSDSDEPKKHSIFDIVDDEYNISMYDKVKARSCKNMQKQEEEKRQEKIKAKFSQLKQSRAKREEKKRSSWDEDSDSDSERRKSRKISMDSSSDEDHITIHSKKREKSQGSSLEYDRNRTNDYFDTISNEEDSSNKLSRKNSRTRIMSDSSDDENSRRKASKSPCFIDRIKKEVFSDSESSTKCKDIDADIQLKQPCEDKVKKTSLLNLFGKSDSEDNRLKPTFENDNDYRMSFTKTFPNDLSSENESIPNRISSELRRKHKKKQKRYKFTYSDEENKSNHDGSTEIRNKHKNSDKSRRHSNKKEKRRDKIRDSIDADEPKEEKDKIKIEKCSPNQSFDTVLEAMSNNNKKEGKMEDIFGPLSDESDREVKTISNRVDVLPPECETSLCTAADKLSSDEMKIRDKEEIKRRKEKRRKEKRHFVKEDDNSLDVDAVSKAIEARLFEESNVDNNHSRSEKTEAKVNSESDLKYMGINYKGDLNKYNEKSKKESRERKKKKKRNREERQSRKEHHHEKLHKMDSFLDNHMEQLSPKTLLDIPLPTDIPKVEIIDKSDDSKSLSESPSLPRITDSPTFVLNAEDTNNTTNEYDTPKSLVVDDEVEIDYEMTRNIEVTDIPMPPPIDNIVQDISEVPLPKDPPIDQVLEISLPDSEDSNVNTDVKESEVAVKSISNLEPEIEKPVVQSEKNISDCKLDKKLEEKPRAIISQEETEDAVAALLGESFGGKVNTFDCYEEVECNTSNEMEIENTTIESELIPEEDAEEMRQAVQNLNASEMEMKPDTPVSDDNLLLIDTDTEETEDTTQDTIDRLPVDLIATNQSLNNNTKITVAQSTEVSSIVITKPKPTMANSVQKEINESINNVKEEQVKPPAKKQETVEQITSTATPVITSWTLSNNKLIESQVANVPVSSASSREISENTQTHIKTNIVQIKTSHSPKVQINNTLRPIINSNRVSTAPYQVINQMIRPQVSNIQPPTIKIPEPHIIYQKPTNIVISPRINSEPLILSPKSSVQTEGMTSPRLPNMALLSTSPQNVVGSPSTAQQRAQGQQVTVVRMQQSPLSPIHSMHIPHARAMVSPNRPNSVLVQTQGTPIHFNRLPVTPVLAPISKQINANIIQSTKGSGSYDSVLIQQQKICQTIPGDRGKMDSPPDASKIILSPNRLQSSVSTVMAQNRLIPVQNSIHVSNINSGLNLPNKVLINNKSPFSDKRDTHISKSENIIAATSSPIIHLSGPSYSSSNIIQANTKSVTCNLQEVTTVSRGHGSNVIHSINTQRLVSSSPITSVIQLEPAKGPPSVLSMAAVRTSSPGVKQELSTTVVVTTSSLANVVMTPLLLKTSPNPKPTLRLHTRSESEQVDAHSNNEIQASEDRTETSHKELGQQNNIQQPSPVTHLSPIDRVGKCETDFEELLKDNINEIKITNEHHKKIDINVNKNVAIIGQVQNRRNSIDNDVALMKHEVENFIKNEADNENTIKKSDSVDMSSVKKCENELSTKIKPDNNMLCITEKIPKTDEDDLSKPMESNTTIAKENHAPAIPTSVDINDSIRPESGVNKNDFYNPLCIQTQAPTNDIKSLDESEYWSGKDIINIESVIKKVDSLCSDNVEEKKIEENTTKQPLVIEMKKSVERNVQNEIFIEESETAKTEKPNENKVVENAIDPFQDNSLMEDYVTEKIGTGKRGGRSGRGKKSDRNPDKVHTRQIAKTPRGTSKRGRGRGKVDKKIKNMINTNANNMPGDVYDFHEDSGDETVSSPNKTEVRPRLILTIKSPLSGNSNTVVSTLSIAQKDPVKVTEKHKEEKSDVFASPSINTRKSRRLQEKDIQRSSVDDIIDDVVKGTANQFKTNNKDSNKKKCTRQTVNKTGDKALSSDTRKSPRGVKRTRDRSLSDASTESCEENIKTDEIIKESKIPKLEPTIPPTKCTPEPVVKPLIVTSQSATTCPPNNNPIPIMKPPKKMISEISAKLASAFEAAANATNRIQERSILPSEPERLPPPAEGAIGDGDAGYGRRLVDNVPSNMMPVGATEATDARVQSPALPHRPPSSHHLPDRATPILVRGGDGEGGPIAAMGPLGAMGAMGGAMGGMDAGAALYRGAYPGPASLPRGAHHPPLAKQVAVIGQNHHPGSRVTITSVPAGSPQGPMAIGEGVYPHFSHHHYQMYQQHFRATQQENRDTPTSFTRGALDAEGSEAPTPPLELRRPPSARVPRPAHSPSPHDRHIMYAVRCGRSPPPAHGTSRPSSALPPPAAPGPPHASQVPREADSLQMLLRRYPVMWQGLLALKNDSAAVQMHFVGGNPGVAADALSRHSDGTAASLLRIAQRMRLEPAQLDQVHRKMKLENEHCMLLALPCGRDHMDVLQQSTNLTAGFITYLQRKQAAGIVNVAPTPGHHQSMYTVHIFPSCEFANENLTRIAPDLMHRVSNIAHLLIVIATAIG